MSTTNDFKVTSFDKLELYCRTWSPPPATPTKARILFLHGFGENIEAYNVWFPQVAEAGYEITCYDQRGFGRTATSESQIGDSSETCIMKDLEQMVSFVSKDYDGPLILWGFSMGGATCLNYMTIGAQKARFDLYISLGPFVKCSRYTNSGLNALKISILPFLVKIWPKFRASVRLDPEELSNNPESWRAEETKPVNYFKSTVLFMRDAIQRGERLLNPGFIWDIADKPLMLAQGESDRVCDVEATNEFFDLVKLTDKKLILYPGLPHEVIQCVEKDRQQYWKDAHEWLDQHIEKIDKKRFKLSEYFPKRK